MCAVQYNKDFGYSRKDVILIGVGIIALGYAMYYGAQAVGIEANAAGNYVQLFIFLVICVGYVSTYIFRVANKVNALHKPLSPSGACNSLSLQSPSRVWQPRHGCDTQGADPPLKCPQLMLTLQKGNVAGFLVLRTRDSGCRE